MRWMYNCPIIWTHPLSRFSSGLICTLVCTSANKFPLKTRDILRQLDNICQQTLQNPVYSPLRSFDHLNNLLCIWLYYYCLPYVVDSELYCLEYCLRFQDFSLRILTCCVPSDYYPSFPASSHNLRTSLSCFSYPCCITIYFYGSNCWLSPSPCSCFWSSYWGCLCQQPSPPSLLVQACC